MTRTLRDFTESMSPENARTIEDWRVHIAEDEWKFLGDCTAAEIRRAAAYKRALAEREAVALEGVLPLLEEEGE